MAHALAAKGPLTRSAAGLEAKKSLFDKGKHDSVMKIKTEKTNFFRIFWKFKPVYDSWNQLKNQKRFYKRIGFSNFENRF